MAKASSDGPFESSSACQLDQAWGEKSSTVVISRVTAKAKIASKKVTARANSSSSCLYCLAMPRILAVDGQAKGRRTQGRTLDAPASATWQLAAVSERRGDDPAHRGDR